MWKFVKQFGLQGFIFSLFGVAFLALAGHAALGAVDWVRAGNWQATTATVTDIRRTTGVRSGYHYYHHYRYVVEGCAYTGEYHRDNAENVRGDMIEVIFNPNEPAESARSWPICRASAEASSADWLTTMSPPLACSCC